MTYVVRGLDPAPYRHLFGLPDDDLAERGIVRMTVDGNGYPCRVSLTDRAVGETVLLVNHLSHDVANPYRASHAIFVTRLTKRPRNLSTPSHRCSRPACCRCAASTRTG